MIDVKHRRCEYEGCNTQPTYNYPDETRGRFCKTHMLPDMVDVRHVKCKEKGCKTRPSYNYDDESIGLYCGDHKKPDMVNVVTKKCRYEGCDNVPSYNLPGKSTKLFCSLHKSPDMVDVAHKKCEHEGCNTQATFNYEDQKCGVVCGKHKLKNMIHLYSLKCIKIECNNLAQYNYREEIKQLYCVEHKKSGMVNLCSQNCAEPGCYLCPNFNYPGLNAKFCSNHKLPEMIDVKHKFCVNDSCMTLQNRNVLYRGYCVRCFIHLFPEENISRNFRIKERFVTDFIKENFSDFKMFYDKRTGGCSNIRPDAYLDLLTHVIVIEIDENQHRFYDTTCEQKRLNLLYEDFACRPIIWIRFNPDEYQDKHGVKIKSCFCIDKTTGIQKIAQNKKTEWNLRLQSLKSKIVENINTIPTNSKFEFMYYDIK